MYTAVVLRVVGASVFCHAEMLGTSEQGPLPVVDGLSLVQGDRVLLAPLTSRAPGQYVVIAKMP